MFRLVMLGTALLSLAACGGGGGNSTPAPTPPSSNNPPSANAGADSSYSIATAGYNLDGSSSSDPDGNTLTYSWSVSSEPSAGAAALSSTTAQSPSFTAMEPGDYTFELTVSDPSGATNTDSVVITLVNDAPVISLASYGTNAAIGQDQILDASASSDPNGHDLTYSWKIISAPTDSFLDRFEGVNPTFEFDKAGSYTIELTVSDGYDSTVLILDEFTVDAFGLMKLSGSFVDAEYSSVTDRIVTIDGTRLTIIDADGSERHVSLPRSGQAVSIAPDGETAAVGHDGWVSHIDLAAAAVLDTISVPADIGDIVIDGNNNAYGFPSTGQWVSIENINLANGTVSRTGTVRHQTQARLHPSGDKMYGADRGVSPSDLERYSITSGQVTEVYDSPYHGDYPFCGNLWMGPEGSTILSACRVMVRASNNQSTDLTYVTQLDNQSRSIWHADSSDFSRKWYVIDRESGAGSETLKVYDADTGIPEPSMEFPDSSLGGSGKWFAKFVFADDDTDVLKILAVDSGLSPLESAVLTVYEIGSDLTDPAPVAVADRFKSARTSDNVTLNAGSSYDPNGLSLSYSWSLTDEPSGSSITPTGLDTSTVQFTPSVAGTYEFMLTVDNGERQSAAKTVSVNVFGASEDIVHRLEGSIGDIEYSKALNKAVYISDSEPTAYILDLADFSVTSLDMGFMGFTVGVSPDGLFAAVSHAGKASLIDLTLEEITDTEDFAATWGDIVLDNNYIAHIIPSRDQWVEFHSIDFAGNRFDSTYGPRAGSQTRMHPTKDLVIAANRGLSPSDFEQWDISTFPAAGYRDSPYHGDYNIGGNIWVSEAGDRFLVAGGNSFISSNDPNTDMTYSGALSDNASVKWADASSETGEWAVLTSSDQVNYYDIQFLNLASTQSLAPIPTTNGDAATTGSHVFYSDNGDQTLIVLNGANLVDATAIQIVE